MKSIQELFPECKKSEWGSLSGKPGYVALLEAAGPKALVEVWENDYQGSTYVLCEMDGKFGYMTFGWGSCSYCDSLEGAETLEELEEIRRWMFDSVTWFKDSAELVAYLDSTYDANDNWHRDERKEFVTKVKEYFGVIE